jgi:hypothetical protein
MTHAEAEAALVKAGSVLTAAEAHGLLCGLCSLHPDSGFETWMNEWLPEDRAGSNLQLREQLPRLQAWHTAQCRALALQSDAPAPLLPDGDAPLSDRLAALAEWCESFLYGAGLYLPPQTARDPQTAEALEGLSLIAGADPDSADGGSEDDFTTLLQHARDCAARLRQPQTAH